VRFRRLGFALAVAKPKLKAFTTSKRYVAFIKGRDEGLTAVLGKYLTRIDSVVETLKLRTEEIAAHMCAGQPGKHMAKANRDAFEKRVSNLFSFGIEQTYSLVRQLRRTTYVLTYAGQAEGLGRALGKPQSCNISHDEVMLLVNQPGVGGGDLHSRIEYSFHNLLRDVVQAFQLSQVMESPWPETLERIQRAFPSKRALPRRMARVRMTESSRWQQPPPEDGSEQETPNFSFGTMDDADWQEAVDDYQDEFIKSGRGPYDSVFGTDENPDADGFRYQWEIENEVTNDFVQSVRAGDVDAANENGITDFVWISILDPKTCQDCCVPRDGMTSAEIEEALESGKLDADACDAIAPPAHMNCRCRPGAATADLPEQSPPDFGSWDDWLDAKGNGA
jgi:hypothetical protein